MKKLLFINLLFAVVLSAGAQQNRLVNRMPGQTYSKRMAQTAMRIWPDSFAVKPGNPARWSYDQGVILKGIEGVWKLYGDGNYFNYIQHSMDYYVQEDGSIKDYKREEFNIDHTNNGKVVMMMAGGPDTQMCEREPASLPKKKRRDTPSVPPQRASLSKQGGWSCI